jgi:hypothetical protein
MAAAQEVLPPEKPWRFQPGHGGGPGRPKGEPNKLQRSVRDMIATALDMVGGENYLAMCAVTQPVAFLALVGKTLPLKVMGDPDNPLFVVSTVTRRVMVTKPNAKP